MVINMFKSEKYKDNLRVQNGFELLCAKNISLSTNLSKMTYTLDEAAMLYHLITGACIEGCLKFADSLQLPPNATLTVDDILNYSKGQQGFERFKDKYEKALFLKYLQPIQCEKGVWEYDEVISGGKKDDPARPLRSRDGNKYRLYQANGFATVSGYRLKELFQLEVSTNNRILVENYDSKSSNIKVHISTAADVEFYRCDISNGKFYLESSSCANLKLGIVAKTIELKTCECLNSLGKVTGEVKAQEVELNISSVREFDLKFADCKKIIMNAFPAKDHTIYIPRSKKVKLTGDYTGKATLKDISRDDTNGSVEININKGCSEFIIQGY